MDFDEKMKAEALLNDTHKLPTLIQQLLEDMLTMSDGQPTGDTQFHAASLPRITITDYVQRLSKFTRCSSVSYVIGLIYLDRLSQEVALDRYSIHKMLLTSVVVAAKYNDDQFFKNDYYCRVGGISLQELNNLESMFMNLVGYRLFIGEQVFDRYLQKLAAYDLMNE